LLPVSSTQAYDRAITVFSPDGRLFQVEYAREAVKRGSTALGMIFRDGVLLAIDKNVESRLLKGESIEKIFKVDEHIAVATSGLVADARRLIDHARVVAQQERYVYDEPIDVETLTRDICDLKQTYTQFGGARPFGAALLIMGIDKSGKHLFETDPSGAFRELYASSIGSGKPQVDEILEKEYDENMSMDDAVSLALRVLTKVGDKKISENTVDIFYIMDRDRKVIKMSRDEIKAAIEKVVKKKGQKK